MTPVDQTASTVPAPVLRQCSCGVAYTALEWSFLEHVGAMDDGDGGLISLRNCRGCHSTISVREAVS